MVHDIKIKIVGIGGFGLATVIDMHEAVIGPDYLLLSNKPDDIAKIHFGEKILLGNGVTTNHSQELGKKRVESSAEEIKKSLTGYDIVIIVSGLGYGTGTGGSPVVASIARELGAFTIAICSTPFLYEGSNRETIAKTGIFKLKAICDSLLVVSKQKLVKGIRRPEEDMTEKLKSVSDLIRYIVTCINDNVTLSTGDGLTGIDGLKAVLRNGNDAFFGCGAVMNEESLIEAVRHATNTPLLNATLNNASRVLLTVSYSRELNTKELNTVYDEIRNITGSDTEIIYTHILNEECFGIIFVSIFASGEDLKEEKVASSFDKLRDAINPNNLI